VSEALVRADAQGEPIPSPAPPPAPREVVVWGGVVGMTLDEWETIPDWYVEGTLPYEEGHRLYLDGDLSEFSQHRVQVIVRVTADRGGTYPVEGSGEKGEGR